MAQLKDTAIDGSLVVSGAGSFGDAAQTRQNINYMGRNQITVDDDVPTTWRDLGTGSMYINSTGLLANQPAQYGFLDNASAGSSYSTIHQFFRGTSGLWWRAGESSAWYDSTADWVRVVDKNLVNKSLWSGSWASGNITVSGTENYTMFLIKMSGQGTLIPAFKNGEYIRGVGGYVNTTPTDLTYHFAATVSGNTWTFVGCDHMWHGSESVHGARTLDTVTGIYGLI